MSETQIETSGVDNTQEQTASGEAQKQATKDTVAYETYRKTVAAEKSAKARADELAKKVKEYEEKEMASQGKSQELIESLRNQVKERDDKINNVVGSFAYRAVASRIREEAIKQGCLDVDLLLKAGSDEFGKIEVNAEDGFSVNSDDLKRFFETTVQRHPMLFKKSGPKVVDGSPANAPIVVGTDFSKMKPDQLLEAWKNLK
jgi:hypothetical protein